MRDKDLFITGIGTGVGKTVAAAVLTEYFQADYWKPVQAGDLHQSDSMKVAELVGQGLCIHPERYRLKMAVSPHQAAAAEAVQIQLEDFQIPETENRLLIEGAGGLFVPFNEQHFMIDLIAQTGLPVVLVIRDYLGCINHSLLSVETLKQRSIAIAYVVFNGAFNPATRRLIEKHLPNDAGIINLPEIDPLDRLAVHMLANKLKTI